LNAILILLKFEKIQEQLIILLAAMAGPLIKIYFLKFTDYEMQFFIPGCCGVVGYRL